MANKTGALVAAAVVGVLAIGGIKAIASGGASGTGASGVPTSVGTPRSGCTTVAVAASSEKAELLKGLAADYNKAGRTVNGKCFGIGVYSAASGTAEQALARGWDPAVDGPRPDVWTPAASSWVGLLREDLAKHDRPNILPDEAESITSTPLVLAMPKPMATALGWPKKPLGWSDVYKLANDPRGWASVGHPEWGKFRLGKTNPNISTSGLEATVGAFVAATGRSSDLSAKDLTDPKVRSFVTDVEHSVVHYGDTTLTFLTNLQRADDQGQGLGYVSAVAVEEKSVLDYNNGNPSGDPKTLGEHAKPSVPLVAVYPKEGTLFSDSPFVTMNAPWVSPEKKAGAADFLAYLRAPAAQKVFTDAGFRTYDGKPGDPIKSSDAVLVDGVKVTLNPPAPEVLDGVRSTWTQVRKRARVLLVLDVSGSMGQQVESAGMSKLDLAKKAAVNALDDFADTDEVGLWAFTTDLPGNKTHLELAPVAPIGPQRAKLKKSIEDLTPLDGTPLYAVTRDAAQAMSSVADDDHITAVVVLTDGRNEDAHFSDLDKVVRELSSATSETGGVRVFTIAYGQDADLATLKKISQATNAVAYDATNAENIDKVFTAVISNF